MLTRNHDPSNRIELKGAVVVRAFFAFALVFLVARLIGRRELSKMALRPRPPHRRRST